MAFSTSHRAPVNVLVTNATSPKNPGDQAMLTVMLDLVKGVHPQAKITIHAADPHLYPRSDHTVKHTLYSWSVFADRRLLSRCLRVGKLFVQYAMLRLGIHRHGVDESLSDLVNDYRQADLILFVGGGYLRSRKGITQSLNVLMQLFLFQFATLFTGKKITGPMSVGPFGHDWQEKTVVGVLNQMDIVATREHFSAAVVEKYAGKNHIPSSDHAIMTRKVSAPQKDRSLKQIIIGFTIRPWLSGKEQIRLETAIVEALEQFASTTGAKIQPIVQVDAPEYGEDDETITTAIMKRLQRKKVTVLPRKTIHTVADALRVYAEVDLLLGMRMHSNIFAATQGTPFVAISYEYKTEGIAKQLGMEQYCIPCETIDSQQLYILMRDAYTNRKSLNKQLKSAVKQIHITEKKQWEQYLSL